MSNATELTDTNGLVRFSRAGDTFHYRWAARRCLHMVNPNSTLKRVIIEGSKERKLAGEYVIDVAEYYQATDSTDELSRAYFQLKHSTKRLDTPFVLSDLKETIVGFAERHIELVDDDANEHAAFTIVTNRPFCQNFKDNIQKIIRRDVLNKRFLQTIESYTKLKGQDLADFCSLLSLDDGEGNYLEQRYELHFELSELLAGVVDSSQVDTIISLVSDKALPHSNGGIIREDILKRLGATSDRDLFPAPPKFEPLDDVIKREQHDELLNIILNANNPVIIHAEGGVGKSVVCRQLVESLPSGSKGIVYDCFGAGKYRNRSESRHRYRDALVQISNELAAFGLCESLIPRNSDQDDALLRAFIERVTTSIASLRKLEADAILTIFIDAADNAEMAANEISEPCFAHQLLRENIPEGCKLISLCRTERRHLLKPLSSVEQYPLLPFSHGETSAHIRKYFPKISDQDCVEFLRLTGGNPRVQANCLMMGYETISETLASLGTSPITVNDQIEAQLDSAVCKIKEELPESHQDEIESICLGLANLPPFIPLSVLALAANVEEASIKSFVFDLGRPLWVSDSSVQFRDEPTETWFRERYSANKIQISDFIHRIKPLAETNSYVSEALPALLLQAECYEELVRLSLSDDLLPQDSPIDARNIRIYRLQFSFKAALKLGHIADATTLAMRAGEEVAGDDRQYALLKKNIDLIAPLQSRQRVQELAYRRTLCGTWLGSENVYSAALLSTIPDFKGEARSYLRSAENWLHLYFDERGKEDGERPIERDRLENDEIIELAYAHYQIFGENELVSFIMSWRPPEVISNVVPVIIGRLVDAGDFDAIERILLCLTPEEPIRYQYFCLAITQELWKVARTPPVKVLRMCLSFLINKKTQLPDKKNNYGDKLNHSGIISFAEACASKNISKRNIQKLLCQHTVQIASHHVRDEFNHRVRYQYLRGIALGAILSGDDDFDIETLLPQDWLDKEKEHHDSRELRQFNELVGGMLPWHIVRAKIIVGTTDNLYSLVQMAAKKSSQARTYRWREHDTIPFEISRIRFEILACHQSPSATDFDEFITHIETGANKFWINDQLCALRASCRVSHLAKLAEKLEQHCFETIDGCNNESPEDRADWYISLARAVIHENKPDATAYFCNAIESVSKFGDEMTERWEAVAAIAKRAAASNSASYKMPYRFIRCAELVGDYVAREKYIDRDGAVEICAMMSPEVALSSLSRWRDRDVGWIDRQLPVLVKQCIKQGVLPPSVAWAFSAFSGCCGDESIAVMCLSNEIDPKINEYILDTAVNDLLVLESSCEKLKKLQVAADDLSINNSELDEAVSYCESAILKNKSNEDGAGSRVYGGSNESDVDWDAIFHGTKLISVSDISAAIERFKSLPGPRHPEIFWKHLYNRISSNTAYYFLVYLVDAEFVEKYDVENVIEYFPSKWRGKASIQRLWPNFIRNVARRFAIDYTNYYSFKYFLEKVNNESLTHLIRQGIIEGLSNIPNFISASSFFGFAQFSTSNITPEEAQNILDYSLSRFEEHMDEGVGDGRWSEWLLPPESMIETSAGYIWSALGSPRSSTRWDAVHCVRRLAEMSAVNEIDALLSWMNSNKVAAFGSIKYPFYDLHAKQYLLIAFARIAIDSTQLLKKHFQIFRDIALNGASHIIIQKLASEVALAIESDSPGIFDNHTLTDLKHIAVSKLPVKNVDRYRNSQITPWHEAGEIDTTLELYFFHDFDRYWLSPLGDVFGISTAQVEQLARDLIINEWNIYPPDRFIEDPRKDLWRSGSYNRETWSSHSEYPRTDDYQFYISYHAMLTIASRLLQTMPVIHDSEWHEDEWAEWIHRHSLSRYDGRWLSDRRDPPPLFRRNWLSRTRNESWRWEVSSDDFLDGLLMSKGGTAWLNVYGSWNECDDSRNEDYSIVSAFVSSDAAQSLVRTLEFCEDSFEPNLSHYLEECADMVDSSFELKRWILQDDSDVRLDEHDPHAGDIRYPPINISDDIVGIMDIAHDLESRGWHKKSNVNNQVLESRLWGAANLSNRDEYNRHGYRLSGSLEFLMQACERLKKELIIEVKVSRSINRSYVRDEEYDVRYPPPYSKVYILSADGMLRNSRESYQLRKTTD